MTSLRVRAGLLALLVAQNCAVALVMHESTAGRAKSEPYSRAQAVVVIEVVKGLVASAVALTFMRPAQVYQSTFSRDAWLLAVPAAIYVVQNYLHFVAIANLSPSVFQVVYQLKVLTTALCSVAFLGRRLSMRQWTALVVLVMGVALVQVGAGPAPSRPLEGALNPTLGFGAAIVLCILSGVAGVYIELVLKSGGDVWIRNTQLSLWSLIPAALPLYKDKTPFLAHFGPWAWGTVALNAGGGLLTALVVRHTDSILKGYAVSVSIVLGAVLSVALFGYALTPLFVIGAALVLASTVLYQWPARPKDVENEQSIPMYTR
ncbi:hypothetical protein MCUN1_003873 [Malassezia cuniculi]|uniref:UDP-galactose transporter n=1 Tax=Malassezia cuniculi TaxID=948313 RepID=A0AAF0EU55_9BASI|nr:hypothetical protein MCUN1_003873 [Malassezia cuniculi]